MEKAQIVEAAEKFIGELDSAFVMGTVSPEGRPHVFYMGAMVLEAPFTLYMETHDESHKVGHIKANPNVEVVAARKDWSEVLTFTGTAVMESDPAVKRRVWDRIPLSGRYFDGPDAPGFGVIHMTVKKIQLQKVMENPMVMHTAEL